MCDYYWKLLMKRDWWKGLRDTIYAMETHLLRPPIHRKKRGERHWMGEQTKLPTLPTKNAMKWSLKSSDLTYANYTPKRWKLPNEGTRRRTYVLRETPYVLRMKTPCSSRSFRLIKTLQHNTNFTWRYTKKSWNGMPREIQKIGKQPKFHTTKIRVYAKRRFIVYKKIHLFLRTQLNQTARQSRAQRVVHNKRECTVFKRPHSYTS